MLESCRGKWSAGLFAFGAPDARPGPIFLPDPAGVYAPKGYLGKGHSGTKLMLRMPLAFVKCRCPLMGPSGTLVLCGLVTMDSSLEKD